jgi:hypothetical protein
MYAQRPKPEIVWDRPGLFEGVTIIHQIQGQRYAWKIPWNGAATQATAADILGVSLMAVNNWARSGAIKAFKPEGQPSMLPLSEIKRVRKILEEYGRLNREALGQ